MQIKIQMILMPKCISVDEKDDVDLPCLIPSVEANPIELTIRFFIEIPRYKTYMPFTKNGEPDSIKER